MKTVEQLLQLSKNPYYKLSNDEKQVLDDFLSKKQDSASKKSAKKSSKGSSAKTNVRVTNVVEKVDTNPEKVTSGFTDEDDRE